MHIQNDPSFFLTNKTGAPQGEELGLINPLSDSSFSCSDNSFILEGAITIRWPTSYNVPASSKQIDLKTLVESEEDPASPQGIHQENLKLSVRPQVASSLTCLPSPLYDPTVTGQMADFIALVASGSTWTVVVIIALRA
ncbi:hypothetical protein Tco_0772000 [Tanacetum coccineum]|uniref:Uncharacterized protein n=1 Tax=Tanacetum coccineum TaxID=301880 RepID=A0ABQ4ZGQ6_9ASTR